MGEGDMAVCDYCGVREAFLLAQARQPKIRRPELRLCNTCWDGKWSRDEYDAAPLPVPTTGADAAFERFVRPAHVKPRHLA